MTLKKHIQSNLVNMTFVFISKVINFYNKFRDETESSLSYRQYKRSSFGALRWLAPDILHWCTGLQRYLTNALELFPALFLKITSRAVFASTGANLGNHNGFLTSFTKSYGSSLNKFFWFTALASSIKTELAVISLDGNWDCERLARTNTHPQLHPRLLAVVTIFNWNDLFVSFITTHVCGRNWLLE